MILLSLAVSSWIIYWDGGKSLRAYERYGGSLAEVSVFAYQFGPDGALAPARPQVLAAADAVRLKKRCRTAVSVVNDRLLPGGGRILKDPAIVSEALATPERRRAHVALLLRVAEGFDGLEMDYENLRYADRDAYSALIFELARALHARGQTLSVVVQAKTKEAFRDGPGAMDWKALGAEADELKVMAYNLHTAKSRPGPISPPDWIAQIVAYARTQLPLEKLCVILPLHGFDWRPGGLGSDLLWEKAMDLAKARGAKIERDEDSREARLTYEEKGERREAWFQDEESLRAKLDVLKKEGVKRVALWKLGTGDPAFWDRLAFRSGK